VGSNAQGQLGFPATYAAFTEPREIPFFLPPSLPPSLRPTRVEAGHAHSFVICEREGVNEGGREGGKESVIYAFGCDRWLQLGLGRCLESVFHRNPLPLNLCSVILPCKLSFAISVHGLCTQSQCHFSLPFPPPSSSPSLPPSVRPSLPPSLPRIR
jgi:hypothetical protein